MRELGSLPPKQAWRFALPLVTTAWVALLFSIYFTIDSEFALVLLTPVFPLAMGGLAFGLLGLMINWAMWFVIFMAIRAGYRGRQRYWESKS